MTVIGEAILGGEKYRVPHVRFKILNHMLQFCPKITARLLHCTRPVLEIGNLKQVLRVHRNPSAVVAIPNMLLFEVLVEESRTTPNI